MNHAAPIAGSYRDPAGGVHRLGDRILRTVADDYDADFTAALRTGLLDRFVDEGRIVAFETLTDEPRSLGLTGASRLLEHPRLPFISHPYEWSFEALRAAALHHLDLHLSAMEGELTLSDATAYNVQFVGTDPIFIDHLSFRPYREGEIWAGYRQFCEQFLNPLVLCAATGLMPNAWYRGRIEGIATADVARLLPWRARFSRRILLHVVAHAALENAAPDAARGTPSASAGLPRASFLNMLRDLRAWIAKLHPKKGRSLWSDYTTTCSYSDEEQAAKEAEVAAFATMLNPKMLWDIGCNTGEYSLLALKSGAAYAIGWDGDARAVDAAFRAARAEGARLTPLVGDLANPSPSQGWGQAERAGMQERSNADAALALAVVHHLLFGANVPLPQAVGWIVGLASRGLIEFVPPTDVQVRGMIARRNGVHHPYDREHFVAALTEAARIERSTVIGPSGRELFWYDRTG